MPAKPIWPGEGIVSEMVALRAFPTKFGYRWCALHLPETDGKQYMGLRVAMEEKPAMRLELD